MHTSKLNEHIQTLAKNKIPKDGKGNDFKMLEYEFTDYKVLETFLDTILLNTEFKGELVLKSKLFDELLGYKIAKVIEHCGLTTLRVENKNAPFNDKVSTIIGNALAKNTTLKHLDSYFDIEPMSACHIVGFLTNKDSVLEGIKHMKMTNELFDYIIEHLTTGSRLKSIGFYFVPFDIPNLLYKHIIPETRYSSLADKIQTSSNLTSVDIISIKDEYTEDINRKLTDDVFRLHKTLEFACEVNKAELSKEVDIESVYNKNNTRMNKILENLNEEAKPEKNSVVSVRSYLNKTIGELLNNALYELEIRREREQDKPEYFTAKGSIQYVAQFLLDNKP